MKRSDDFWCYAFGICYASVCTSLEPDAAAARLNDEVKKELDAARVSQEYFREWKLADERFRTGEKNGCQCPDKPTHRHFLFAS